VFPPFLTEGQCNDNGMLYYVVYIFMTGRVLSKLLQDLKVIQGAIFNAHKIMLI